MLYSMTDSNFLALIFRPSGSAPELSCNLHIFRPKGRQKRETSLTSDLPYEHAAAACDAVSIHPRSHNVVLLIA